MFLSWNVGRLFKNCLRNPFESKTEGASGLDLTKRVTSGRPQGCILGCLPLCSNDRKMDHQPFFGAFSRTQSRSAAGGVSCSGSLSSKLSVSCFSVLQCHMQSPSHLMGKAQQVCTELEQDMGHCLFSLFSSPPYQVGG